MIKEKLTFSNKKYTVSYVGDKPEYFRKINQIKTGIAIFEDGKLGIAAGVGEVDTKDLEKQAKENMELGFTYDYELSSDVSLKKVYGDEKVVDGGFLKSFGDKLNKEINNISDKVVCSTKLTSTKRVRTIETNNGVDLSTERNYLEGYVILKKAGGADLFDGFVGIYEEDSDIQIDRIVNDAKKMIDLILSEPVKLESGKEYSVCFIDNFLGGLTRHLIGDSYHKGNSLFNDKLNEKILSERVTIYEDSASTVSSSIPFDSEYILREDKMPFIKNGKLVTLAYDKKNAKKYNVKPTGSGFRDITTRSQSVIQNLSIEKTFDSLLELSKKERIIVPIMSAGGNFTESGEMSTPVQLGLVLENGKIIGKTPQMAVVGNILSMLGDGFVESCSNDLFHMSRFDVSPVVKAKVMC